MLNPESFSNLSLQDLDGVQRVFIEDYKILKDELSKVSVDDEEFAILEGRKDRVLESINVLGRLIDEKDGTISTRVN